MQLNIETVKNTILGTIVVSIGVFALAHGRPESKMEMLNVSDSANIQKVAQEFSRLQTGFDSEVESEQLLYRLRKPSTDLAPDLTKLLVDLSGGPDEIPVPDLVEMTAQSDVAGLSRYFLSENGDRSFDSALKSVLASPEAKVFSSEVSEPTGPSRVLIVADEKTNELLLLFVSVSGEKRLASTTRY